MDSKKTSYVTIALSILLFLAFLIAQQTLKRDNSIILPESTADSEVEGQNRDPNDFNALSITTNTVQAAISTLSRPAAYERTQTVETFWSSGSSSSTYSVAVRSGVTRIDTTMVDGSVYHILMNDQSTAVWYDDETTWATLAAGEYTSDTLQRIPTYETVLTLRVFDIAAAEYCTKDDIRCIFVQTRQNMDGYTESYWISVQSGLLYAAERFCNGELIYRFTATEPNSVSPDESRFLLPDGSRFS